MPRGKGLLHCLTIVKTAWVIVGTELAGAVADVAAAITGTGARIALSGTHTRLPHTHTHTRTRTHTHTHTHTHYACIGTSTHAYTIHA
jgi:hypothetical protein